MIHVNIIISVIRNYLLIIPILCVSVFYSFVFRARISLKVWPTPNNPDPKLLGFNIHQILIYFLLFLAFASIPVFIYWAAFLSKPITKNRFNIITISLSWAIFVILIYTDPFKFIYWFFD